MLVSIKDFKMTLTPENEEDEKVLKDVVEIQRQQREMDRKMVFLAASKIGGYSESKG